MALNYKILESKPKLRTPEGEQYYDLLADVYTGADIPSGELFIVTEDYVARPDLVSFVSYNDDKYADIICKMNGISNPFELNVGDILYIPDIEYIMNCVDKTSKASQLVSNVELQNELSNRIITSQKMKNEKRSPNEQTIGDENLVIDKSSGIILY